MAATVHSLGRRGPLVVTKQQLAAELGRSVRWIELRVNEGMPVESNTDRHGRRLFDLNQVRAWLDAGRPKATAAIERMALVEQQLEQLAARVQRLERERAR